MEELFRRREESIRRNYTIMKIIFTVVVVISFLKIFSPTHQEEKEANSGNVVRELSLSIAKELSLSDLEKIKEAKEKALLEEISKKEKELEALKQQIKVQ